MEDPTAWTAFLLPLVSSGSSMVVLSRWPARCIRMPVTLRPADTFSTLKVIAKPCVCMIGLITSLMSSKVA
ncbi:hypothetical protein D3C79_951830 [compost metagenome]